MIKVAIWVLRAANWLNWIMGALFALLLAMMAIWMREGIVVPLNPKFPAKVVINLVSNFGSFFRALLTINLVDLAFGQVSIWASEASGEYLGWSLSLTGWFAVPLLLILARIFKEGAIMRDDLEGTV